MDKIIEINNLKYYCLYYMSDDIVGDFRFCVSLSSGDVYYQTTADLESLMPISQYLQEMN